MKKFGVALLVLGVIAIAAAPVSASNMGFKKTFNYVFDINKGNVHWISLPWFYSPTDTAPVGLDAQDVCADLGAGVFSVRAWDDSAQAVKEYACGLGTGNFLIAKGEAIGVSNDFFADINGVVVGSHDNAYVFSHTFDINKGNVHFDSIPYHHNIPTAPNLAGLDAQDVCTSVGAGIFSVRAWDDSAQGFKEYACGLGTGNFTIALGEGIAIVNDFFGDMTWTVPHY